MKTTAASKAPLPSEQLSTAMVAGPVRAVHLLRMS